MKTLISHPTGNQNVRAATKSFTDAGILSEFYTAIATFPGDLLDYLSNIGSLSEFRRRRFDTTIQHLTKTWPWFELGRLMASKAGFSNLTRHETGLFCIDAVYKSIDGRVASNLKRAARKGTNAVYAYEDGAALSFQEAKHLGLQCFYDLPIGYWRTAHRILKAEKDKWPSWASTLTSFKDSEAKLSRKDEELNLADRIFVASQFTARTLEEFPGCLAPIEVIPYGFPPVSNEKDFQSIPAHRKLKLLFVGGLSQRKGIANLFTAVESLKDHVDLTIVGRKPNYQCPALDAALAKHHWIPSLPHEDILKLMQVKDLLVFPSLFEGFGLVITEAMSQGTPVITTERTAGPDLIENGQNGWVIEAGSTEALIDSIENILYKPKTLTKVGKAAKESASIRPWEVYGRELAESILKN